MKSLNVLVISFSDLSRDPRVHKQLQYLRSRGATLTTLAEKPSCFEDIKFLNCSTPGTFKKLKILLHLLMRNYERAYWNHPRVVHCQKILNGSKFDLIIANDLETLPLACAIGSHSKIVFDAHEYAPLQFQQSYLWRVLFQPMQHYLCQAYLKRADCMMTVCEGLANAYKMNYKTDAWIVPNYPYFGGLHCRVPSRNTIRMIYHGLAIPARNIEKVLKMMSILDERFKLDVILVPGCPKYIKRIKSTFLSHPRIRFLEPVQVNEIPRLCNAYDIGFFPLPPCNFNYMNALPNKFFEFIQGCIPPAIFPQPEMARIARAHSCGIIAKDFQLESLAEELNALEREDLITLKQNCESASKLLCAEENFRVFDKMFDHVLFKDSIS